VPVWEAFVAWSAAGLGMGFSYAPISLMMLRAAPPGREGWASASLNLADVLGIALGVGIGGAAVAAVSRGSRPVAGGVVIAFAVAALAAVLALVIARRLPGSLDRAVETPATP
jgi:MFS family permease